jgi:hypothetical protein
MKRKRLSAVLILGFVILSFCAAQSQEGNASYNPSKTGLHISHSSLSFNTRVKVTNLRNNRSVEAVVDDRILPSSERIADISRDAGDALEMNKSGMTLVRIEEIHRGTAQTSVPAEPPPARETVPKPAAPPPVVIPVTPAPVQQDQTPPPPQILPVQTVTEYIQVPAAPAQPCCSAPLLLAILLLLILVIILLVVILVLFLRGFPLWPWRYPFWLRRYYYRYKKQRN